MKKYFLKFMTISMGLLLPMVANATREVGNGGVGIYCKEETDPAKVVQLFDLYEGSVLQKLTPLDSNLDFDNYALSFATNLDSVIDTGRPFRSRIEGVSSILQLMPSGVGLRLTDDVLNFIYPKACQLVQILNYRNGLVYVDSDYWSQLSNTSKAAAILHEAIYSYAREKKIDSTPGDGDTTSGRTRRAVAILMSGQKLEKVIDYVDTSNVLEQFNCTTPFARNAGRSTTNFVMSRFSSGFTHVTFTRLGGLTMLSRTTTDIPFSIREHAINSIVSSLIDWDVRVEIDAVDSGNGTVIAITRNGRRTVESVSCTLTDLNY